MLNLRQNKIGVGIVLYPYVYFTEVLFLLQSAGEVAKTTDPIKIAVHNR